MALTSGTKLGPYEIQSPLGAGGIGEVYRARDTRLERIVAIKILPAAFASDVDRLLRFQQEARVLSALNHPNLLTIFDVGNQDNSYYLVCELLEGETLRERLNSGPLALRKAVDYGIQMANGLGAARTALAYVPKVTETRMFRGITFMVDGKMCVSVSGDELDVPHRSGNL